MSLIIGMPKEGTRPVELEPGTRVNLEDDGYYWFLYPLFERLAERTGQIIDPYSAATFAGPAVAALRETLAEARRLVVAMPEQWDVKTGESIGSTLHPTPPTPVYETVRRDAFERLLRRFEGLVDAALATDRPIVCLGD
jgi:hypothetical protein